MKTTFLAISLWLLAIPCFAQGVRVGDSLPLQTTAVIQGTTVLTPIASGAIQFCNAPANAVPCTNKATTYTDRTLGTPCSVSVQVVLAGTTTCVANSDALGNWGVWVASANYEWTFTNSAGASFGPFPVTANVSATPPLNSIGNPSANTQIDMGNTNNVGLLWRGSAPPVGTLLFGIGPTSAIGSISNAPFQLLSATDSFNTGSDVTLVLQTDRHNVTISQEFTSDATTLQFKLAKWLGGGVGLATTVDTQNYKLAGICILNCGSFSFDPVIAMLGTVWCTFDASSPGAGDTVIMSVTSNGMCHDNGASTPAAGQYVGRVATNGASPVANTYLVNLQLK